jgi:hypothetical protein
LAVLPPRSGLGLEGEIRVFLCPLSEHSLREELWALIVIFLRGLVLIYGGWQKCRVWLGPPWVEMWLVLCSLCAQLAVLLFRLVG